MAGLNSASADETRDTCWVTSSWKCGNPRGLIRDELPGVEQTGTREWWYVCVCVCVSAAGLPTKPQGKRTIMMIRDARTDATRGQLVGVGGLSNLIKSVPSRIDKSWYIP